MNIFFRLVTTVATIVTVITWSHASLANGGDQRVVAGKYIINLSRVPFTPVARQENKMIVSFGDIEMDALIAQDLRLDVRIQEFNGSTVVFEQKAIPVQDGIFELTYTFTNPGLHEVFFTFTLVEDSAAVYVAPDFLIDVQPAPIEVVKDENTAVMAILISTGIGFLAGALLTWFMLKKKTNP